MERAAGRRRQRARRLPGEHDAVPPAAGVRHRHGGEQARRVGVQRPPEQLGPTAELHDPPQVHHRHPVRELLHRRQVVGDEQQRQPQPLPQVRQQGQDLPPDRDVERRHRLVGHQQLRPRRQGAGDPHPLPLAARQLVGVAVRQLRREPHHGQQLGHPGRLPGTVEPGVDRQRLRDGRRHPLPRVERAVRVLEHHLEPPAPLPQLPPGERREVLAREDDAAGRGLDQPHGATAERRLAAPGLAHQGHAFAGRQLQVDPVQGAQGAGAPPQRAAPHGVILAQPLDGQQRLHVLSSAAPSRGTAASRARV